MGTRKQLSQLNNGGPHTALVQFGRCLSETAERKTHNKTPKIFYYNGEPDVGVCEKKNRHLDFVCGKRLRI